MFDQLSNSFLSSLPGFPNWDQRIGSSEVPRLLVFWDWKPRVPEGWHTFVLLAVTLPFFLRWNVWDLCASRLGARIFPFSFFLGFLSSCPFITKLASVALPAQKQRGYLGTEPVLCSCLHSVLRCTSAYSVSALVLPNPCETSWETLIQWDNRGAYWICASSEWG